MFSQLLTENAWRLPIYLAYAAFPSQELNMKRLETSTTEPFAPVLAADHAPVNAIDRIFSMPLAVVDGDGQRAIRRARRAARMMRRSNR